MTVLPKVEKQLARLVAVTGIQELVDGASADPALAARITKARPASAAAPKPTKKKQVRRKKKLTYWNDRLSTECPAQLFDAGWGVASASHITSTYDSSNAM